jgi:hypothetical protein
MPISGAWTRWIHGARAENDAGRGDEPKLEDSGCHIAQEASEREMQPVKPMNSVAVQASNEARVAEKLRCGICLCMLHKPVTLVPYLHSFCAGCYSCWMRQQHTCPDCRGPVALVGRSHTLSNVVAASPVSA